jgi:DNA end-binding protein Ku
MVCGRAAVGMRRAAQESRMARPYWSGQIQISLVQFGVSLFTATESKSQISFHQISRSTGERIRHQKVLQSAAESDESSPAVGKDDIVKGYEYSKGQYVIIEPSELENLRVPSKHTIAVSQFIDLKELNPEYIEKPYYVVPENDAQTEAFAVVREALLKSGKAALGKVGFSGREHIVALAPAGADSRGMMAYTLRYESELRNAADYFSDIKQTEINEDALEMAEALIAKKTATFDPSKFQDGYEIAVRELVEAKVKNMPIPQDEPVKAQPAKVINLMDALRKSIGGEGESAAARGGKKPPASVKEPAAKGIGLVKEAPKPQAKEARKRKTA